jgi:hypothetical protein
VKETEEGTVEKIREMLYVSGDKAKKALGGDEVERARSFW